MLVNYFSHVLKCCIGSLLQWVRLYGSGEFNPEPHLSRDRNSQDHCKLQVTRLCDHNIQLEVISYIHTHKHSKEHVWFLHTVKIYFTIAVCGR